MPIATSTDHGHNLQTVQLLIKKNQVGAVRTPCLLLLLSTGWLSKERPGAKLWMLQWWCDCGGEWRIPGYS